MSFRTQCFLALMALGLMAGALARPRAGGVGLAMILAVVGAAAFSWALSRSLRRRAGKLAAALENLEGRPHGRADVDDELGPVVQAWRRVTGRFEARLKEQTLDRARLEAVLAGMLEGVLVVDAQGRIRLVNDAATHLLRLAASPIGHHYLEIIRHPDVTTLVAAALDGGQPSPVELSSPHDPEVVFAARAVPTPDPTRGAVLVLHDTTAVRRTDRIRRDFVANVSHELRTPLTAIRGYLEALQDAPADAPERTAYLAVIARHTAHMERLVRDLLRLARLEAGQDPVEWAPVELPDLFEAVIQDLEPAIAAKRQRVEAHVPREAVTIVTDRDKLKSLLRNLVENASTYSPEATTIRLEAARAGDDVTVQVIDEGPGIPEADLSRIFERFYRVDAGRSRESGGAGLGLSIARHLAERMGSEIRAANRPEGGAVFTVRLPQPATWI